MKRRMKVETAQLQEDVFQGVSDCFHGVSECSETVSDCLPGVFGWTAEQLEGVLGDLKTARNTKIHVEKTPLQRAGTVAAGGAVVAALSMTLFRQPGDVQAAMYLLTAAIVLQSNVLELFDRVLSGKTRTIAALVCLVWVLGICRNDDQFLSFCLLLSLGAAWIIWKLNGKWLDAEQWSMTPEVQTALNCTEDSIAYQTWIEYGKREARTLGRSRGHQVTERAVNEIFRDFYILGFAHGYKRTTKAVQNKKDLETFRKHAEDLNQENDRLRQQIAAMQGKIEQQEDERQAQSSVIRALRMNVWKLQEANEQLAGAEQPDQNDQEQPETQPEPPEQPEAAETGQSLEEIVLGYLAQGMSTREAARAAGTNPTRVHKIKHAAEAAETEPEGLEATA